MMSTRGLTAGAVVLFAAAGAMGDGYIWLSAEFSSPFGTPPKIWRYNVGTKTVDYGLEPTLNGQPLDPAADVYNNLATDGKNLFVGGDDDSVFAICDQITGVAQSNPGYNPPPGGSFEDGAWRAKTDTLYRMNIGGNTLIESDKSGNVLSNVPINNIGEALGIEFIGDQAYATNLDLAQFGRLDIKNGFADFVNIPLVGLPQGHITGGLAYDQVDQVLYMATINIGNDGNVWLWHVDPNTGQMSSGVDLSKVGYPVAGQNGAGSYILADGAGWVHDVPAPGTLAILGLGGLVAGRRRR